MTQLMRSVMMTDMAVVYVHGHLDMIGHRLLDGDRNVLVHVHRIRTIDGHMYGNRHRSVDRVRHMSFNGVRLWYGNLNWIRHWFLNMHRVWSIDGNLYLVRYGLFDDIRHGFLDRHGNRARHVNGVWSVDRYMHRIWHLLLNGVRLRYGYFDLHLVRHMLGDLVRLRYGHFYLVRHLLDDIVRLWDTDFDGIRTIDRYMHRIRYLFLNRIRLWNVHGHFDVFFDMYGYMFDDLVGLRNGNFHFVRDAFLDGVRNVFLDRIRHGDSLQQRNRFVNISMTAQIDSMSVAISDAMSETMMTAMTAVIFDDVLATMMRVCTAQMTTAQISYVQTIDAVAIAEIQKTAFVELLFERNFGGCNRVSVFFGRFS